MANKVNYTHTSIGEEIRSDYVDVGGSNYAPQVAIAAGSAAMGSVTVSSIAAGDNNIGNVDLASAIPAGTATIGATMDAGPSWTSVVTFTASADATSPTAVTAAPTTGQYIVVDDIIVSTDTAMSIEFELEDATSTNYMKLYLPANGTAQITPRGKLKLGTANKKLMIDASVAGNVAVTCFHHSEA